MALEFTMPKLGLTMEEGTILQWLVDHAAPVVPGTSVMVVETDKVETEVEIPDGGILHIIGAIGETYRCGELIGWVLAEGEAPPAGSAPAATPSVAPAATGPSPSAAPSAPAAAASARGDEERIFASPYARNRAAEIGVDLATVVGTGPGGRITSEDVATAKSSQPSPTVAPAALATAKSSQPSTAVAPSAPTSVGPPAPSSAAPAVKAPRRGHAPAATFAAAELARILGVDLAATPILATSPDGRISRQDVADHVRSLVGGAKTPGASPANFAALTQEPTTTVAMKGMRGTIATRMRASLHDMAQLTLMIDVDMDAVVADRDARKADGGPTPGYTDYVIAATARALRDHPRMNSQVTADGIAVLPDVHVGVAVALDEGLLVPVVRNADRLDLVVLSAETTRLAEAARDGRLKLTDLEGGTFSVSALGMFGVDGFTPIINPPNAGILGVGRIRDDVAWTDDGGIMRVKRMTLSLTWDHRVTDGAPAAAFVQSVGHYLDDPTTLS